MKHYLATLFPTLLCRAPKAAYTDRLPLIAERQAITSDKTNVCPFAAVLTNRSEGVVVVSAGVRGGFDWPQTGTSGADRRSSDHLLCANALDATAENTANVPFDVSGAALRTLYGMMHGML